MPGLFSAPSGCCCEVPPTYDCCSSERPGAIFAVTIAFTITLIDDPFGVYGGCFPTGSFTETGLVGVDAPPGASWAATKSGDPDFGSITQLSSGGGNCLNTSDFDNFGVGCGFFNILTFEYFNNFGFVGFNSIDVEILSCDPFHAVLNDDRVATTTGATWHIELEITE